MSTCSVARIITNSTLTFRGNTVFCPKKFRGNVDFCPEKFRGNVFFCSFLSHVAEGRKALGNTKMRLGAVSALEHSPEVVFYRIRQNT